MKRLNIMTVMVEIITLASIFTGCNSRPMRPWPKWYKPWGRDFVVDSADQQEAMLVDAIEKARAEYESHLSSLVQYYIDKGDDQRERWAIKEQKNLEKAHKFEWINYTPLSSPTPVTVSMNYEVEMVDNVVTSREEYLLNIDALAQHLEQKEPESFRVKLIHNAQYRFHHEETYLYLTHINPAPEKHKSAQIIAEANEMYNQALKLYRDGKFIPAAANYEKQRDSLVLFKRLIRQYPQSTRIAESAFYIGEIYKEYFREHYLAVLWYKRALEWEPRIALPVRFQIAVQYDFNLGSKPEALKYYRKVIKHETRFDSNFDYALGRIKEIEKILIDAQDVVEDFEQADTPSPEPLPEPIPEPILVE